MPNKTEHSAQYLLQALGLQRMEEEVAMRQLAAVGAPTASAGPA